jgi:hypothetical protein
MIARKWSCLPVVVACFAVSLFAAINSADAQILRPVRAGGYIEYDSGFPGGFVHVPFNPIPPAGISLQRGQISFLGRSQGGTAFRILVAPNGQGYLFQVATNSYLQQLRNSCFGIQTPPAKIKIHFDCHFDIGPQGFVGGPFNILYPMHVVNTHGWFSYTSFQADFVFHQKVAGVEQGIGMTQVMSLFPFPGQVFNGFVPRPGEERPILLPPIPPNSEFIIWGDIVFKTLGCPIRQGGPWGATGAGAAESTTLEPVAPEEEVMFNFDDFESDPSMTYDTIDKGLLMDMDPFQDFVGCNNWCGTLSPDGCWCDEACFQYGDCCPDVPVCHLREVGCTDYCGEQSPDGCECDTDCARYGDCCPDADICLASPK